MYLMHPFSLAEWEAWRAEIPKSVRACALLLEALTILRSRHEGKAF